MRTSRCLAVLTPCLFALSAGADLFVEVHLVGDLPDGSTQADLTLLSDTALSVSIWSDTPGVSIASVSMALNGRSALGVLGSGGNFSFSQLGVVDPTGAFDSSDDGLIGPGTPTAQNTISSVGMFVFNPALGVTLPTSAGSALVIYEGFRGTAFEPGSGVLPEVFIQPAIGTPPQPVQTFGVYQIPAPAGATPIGLGALAATRRRRGIG